MCSFLYINQTSIRVLNIRNRLECCQDDAGQTKLHKDSFRQLTLSLLFYCLGPHSHQRSCPLGQAIPNLVLGKVFVTPYCGPYIHREEGTAFVVIIFKWKKSSEVMRSLPAQGPRMREGKSLYCQGPEMTGYSITPVSRGEGMKKYMAEIIYAHIAQGQSETEQAAM